MIFEAAETVIVERYTGGGTDSYGNPFDAWGEGEPVEILGFDPGSVSEPRLPGHERVVVEPTIYLPAGEVVASHDRVTVRGLLFEVDGGTREWSHPHLSPAGGVAMLRRVEG